MIEDIGRKPVRVSEAWKIIDGYVYMNSYRKVIFSRKQAQMWELLDGNHTIQEIYDELREFDKDEIDTFIEECYNVGFVEMLEEEEWEI
ncbi:MAG: hypothetical protein IK018_04225 [Lachnospiraceae bacterium]|nr:hypothetical protein [Lachnospiraceae bacterium]